ncbi:MAG: hypothetical protein IKW64_06440 [Clostridia bacterium]|nr:hypothetical protein [Clostridia bacterium]
MVFDMVAKANQEIKRERNRAKRAQIDKATNGYMINLAWGVLVIILLRFVETGYSGNMVLSMPVILKTMAGIFAAAAVGLFVCGKLKVLDKACTFYKYCAFAAVLALGSLWIGFFAQIRNILGGINESLLLVDSRWWVSRGPIVLVAAYLVITLIWTAIKVAKLEKGK